MKKSFKKISLSVVMLLLTASLFSTGTAKWAFDHSLYLQGGLSRGSRNRLHADGELIVNAKSPRGWLLQGAGKASYNDFLEKYGFSLGSGFEPGRIGLFLFVDGLCYKHHDLDRTFHVQVRPTVRLRFKRFSAALFYAEGFGDSYTGVDVPGLAPGGEVFGIYNKALSHYGASVKACLFDRLYIKLNSAAAAGGIYKVECETGIELFKNLYVTGYYHTANFGKYPELAMEGYAEQSRFGMGIRFLFGSRKKPGCDLRTRNIVETDYPIVVSYKKVKEKKEVEKEEEEEKESPAELTVTLTGSPLSGKAPLRVEFSARVKGGQPPYEYRWYFEGRDGASTSGKAKEKHTYYSAGTYRAYVVVEDDTGQKATSNKLEIKVGDSGKYRIIAKAHEGAKITPSGTILAEPGGDYVFAMSALPGYKIDRVEVDGKNIGAVVEYIFKKIDNDHKISVWAKKDDGVRQYRVISLGSSGGHNDPEGTILVDEGDSLKVRIIPAENFTIKDVKVDGKRIGPVSEYAFSNIESDHIIESFFEVGVFYIEAIQNQGGTISPAGTTAVPKGGSQTYTIAVDEGQELTGLLIDGQPIGIPPGNTYTFDNVDADHTIEPLFGQQTFTIHASAVGGGSIVESGAVQAVYGSDKTFRFIAEEGWEATELEVDGVAVPVPANNEYTFENVTTGHTIRVTFTKKTFTITVLYNDGGSITPGTCEVEYGDNKTFEINPNVSHNTADVKVDGGSLGPQSSYTFENVTANHTIEAIFIIKTFYITVITNQGATCTPGSITVPYGSTRSFEFGTDSAGRYIADVKIDNVSQGEQSQWTFANITANHKIELFSEWYYYTISETHQVGGIVTLNGELNPGSIKVRYGESCLCRFKANSDSGKDVENVAVDGVSKGAITTYTFENVTADHTVRLDTEWLYYTIAVSWSGKGRIMPGTTQVRHGESLSFSIQPATDYQIKILKIDNREVQKSDRYTFFNVTESHAIYAEFEKIPLPEFDVVYGGYSFDWHDPNLTPSFGSGGGGPVIREKIEQGQIFSYAYPEAVKDPELPVDQQFDIPFQYVIINGIKYYDRHISIPITGNTTITAYYYVERSATAVAGLPPAAHLFVKRWDQKLFRKPFRGRNHYIYVIKQKF